MIGSILIVNALFYISLIQSFHLRPNGFGTRLKSGMSSSKDTSSNSNEINVVLTPKNNIKTNKLASLEQSQLNLAKNAIGAGVFSLSAKVNKIGPSAVASIPASFLISGMAAWSAYNFYAVGKACELSDSTTYAEAWGKVVSEESKWIVQLITTVAPMVSCLAANIVLADIFTMFVRTLGFPEAIWNNRKLMVGTLGGGILLPLCSLKDLSSLGSVSSFGLLGQAIAMMVLGIRLLDKTYNPGGIYNSITNTAAAVVPTYNPSNWFVLASLLSYCFVTHYNAPRYYNELEDFSMRRYTYLATVSYSVSAVIYIATMYLGLNLFGLNARSFVLNNLSPKDPLATVARMAFGASVLASYPLIFLTVRNWLLSQMEKTKDVVPKFLIGRTQIAFVALSLIGMLTVKFRDIGAVGSLAGALFGTPMAFVLPSIMYLRAMRKAQTEGVKMFTDATETKIYWPRSMQDTSDKARVIINSLGLQSSLWGKYSYKFFLNVTLLFCGVGMTILGATNTFIALRK